MTGREIIVISTTGVYFHNGKYQIYKTLLILKLVHKPVKSHKPYGWQNVFPASKKTNQSFKGMKTRQMFRFEPETDWKESPDNLQQLFINMKSFHWPTTNYLTKDMFRISLDLHSVLAFAIASYLSTLMKNTSFKDTI